MDVLELLAKLFVVRPAVPEEPPPNGLSLEAKMLGSPVRENRTPGSDRGLAGYRQLYRPVVPVQQFISRDWWYDE